MGVDTKGNRFCDVCHGKETENSLMVFKVCAICQGGKMRCERCILLHFRKRHPGFWMEHILPEVKKQNSNG